MTCVRIVLAAFAATAAIACEPTPGPSEPGLAGKEGFFYEAGESAENDDADDVEALHGP